MPNNCQRTDGEVRVILADHGGTTHKDSRAFCKPCGYYGKWREPFREDECERDLARHEKTARHQTMLKNRKRPLRRAR